MTVSRALLGGCIALLALVVVERPDAAPRHSSVSVRDGHTRIPFDLRGQHVWVRGRANGADSIWVVIDTGASSSVLDDAVARRLGLQSVGEHEAFGAGGPQRGHSVENVTLEIAGLTLHRRRMDTIDLAAVSAQGGRPLEFILGHELFESCVVRFDYDAGVIDVWERAKTPRDLPGEAVPMTLIQNHPYVSGELTVPGRGTLRGRFVIDTGSSAALILAPDVTRRESLATAFPRTLVAIGRGVGGELRQRLGRAESFAIGTVRFPGPIVMMPDSGSGYISAPGTIGNIGGQILARTRVTFDFARRLVRFEPGRDFARPFEADMSGATMTRSPGALAVRWVDPDTPAAEAGLVAGDRVTSVDGEPADRVDPSLMRVRMREPGRVVRLGVQRGADSLEVTMTLRRLL